MKMFRKIALLLCMKIILCATASTIKHFEREWNVTIKGLITKDDAIGEDNLMIYAQCNDISNSKLDCILIHEYLHPDGLIFKNKCYVSFSTDKGIDGLNVMKLRTSSKGKVVISYINSQEKKPLAWATAYTTYRLIDTSTCQFYESRVLFNTSALNEQLGDKFIEGNIFLYEDGSFDTFLAQKDLCEGARCKVTFGPDGKMLGEPVSYLSSDMTAKDIKMIPITNTGTPNHFFAVVKELKSKNVEDSKLTAFKLMYASANSEYPDTILDLDDVEMFDVDNSRGVLGCCWSKRKNKNVTTIECRQYNVAQFLTVNATFELPYAVKTLKVKNTWAGEELLLLTDECQDDSCENDGRYYIRAINRQKSYSGNMEVTGLDCPAIKKDVSISVFNKNSPDDKICVSVSCRHFYRTEHPFFTIKLVRQCFMTKNIYEIF